MKVSEKLDNREWYGLDKKDIGACLEQFLKQCSDAFSLGRNLPKAGRAFDKILFCGIGGSGLAGELLKNLGLCYSSLPVYTHRSYDVPSFADSKTLVIVLSYSGNTEEAISAFDAGLRRGCLLVAATSGGILQKRAAATDVPLLLLPQGYQPRMATFLMAFSLLEWLEENGCFTVAHHTYEELYFRMITLCCRWNPKVPTVKNRAKITALQLYEKTPLLWGSEECSDVAARNLKNQLNETAKTIAYMNHFPEVNHNEIVALGKGRKDIAVLTFRNPYEHPRVAKGFSVCQCLLKERVSRYIEFFPEALSYVTTIAESFYFGDWVAYYLAVLYEEDPGEIKEIDRFKTRMEVDKGEKCTIINN